ncbi:MAG: protein kinase [Leptospiraceae bacterium]|nr:protein kinase [Leptospiraceae bacterium]
MNYCPSCKTQLTKTAKFCYSCGLKMPEIDKNLDQDLEFLKRNLEPKFTNIEKIGQGGMGAIFLGIQTSLNRKVVIKLLSENMALDEKIAENFLKEAQIAANVKHPNIVEMVDYGKAEGRPFFIMEFGEKGSFEKILADLKTNQKKLPSLEVCRLMIKILNALDFAHSKDLLAHRDIKPHNIILRDSGDVFITDFGIALNKKDKLQTNPVAGTIDYMSPEQIQNTKDIDARTDIYSMGIVFFEMLTCSLPFESVDKDKILQMHLSNEIPDLTTRFTKEELKKIQKEGILLEDLQAIIRKACEKDKTKRFFSCKEMSDVIQSIVKKVEEIQSVSYKKHRKLITIYSLIAGTLIIFIGFFIARFLVFKTCTDCCVSGNCKSGVGKYVYETGNIFEGEFRNGKKNGKGEYFIYSTKSKYEGNFLDGEFFGFGTLINYSDNDLTKYIGRYTGEFKKNKPEGQGAYYFQDGSYFAGEFKDGLPDGKRGIFYTKDHSLYKGDIKLKDGEMLPEGKGLIIFDREKVYIGDFHNGKLHGKGRLIQPDGTVINGNWENGVISINKKSNK